MMSETTESLSKRVEVLERAAIKQGQQILELTLALEASAKLSSKALENSHLLLDKLGVPNGD